MTPVRVLAQSKGIWEGGGPDTDLQMMKIETVATGSTPILLFNESEMRKFLRNLDSAGSVFHAENAPEPVQVIINVEGGSGHTVRLRTRDVELGMASDTDSRNLRRFADLGACVRAAYFLAPAGHIVFEGNT